MRPTAARVKEALFNILPHDLSGARVLDLFAGTGNLTIEALSRGAAAATLVDLSFEAGKTIRENLRRLQFTDRTRVWIMPAARALRLLARHGDSFDMIFLDPPYDRQWVGRTLQIIAREKLLRESGMVIAEHSIREHVEPSYDSLALRDQRRYGSTLISFFKQAR
jgi:16S rRNA (guanine(966)-N(2))-methyltransferase RsmD